MNGVMAKGIGMNETRKAYFDFNATTPMHESVKAAVTRSLDLWANPSSNNENAVAAAKSIERAREDVARLLGVTPDDVVFTSGGTEANNWVVDHSIKHFRARNRNLKPHFVTTTIEHPSIIVPLQMREANGEIDLTLVSPDPQTGAVESETIMAAMNANTCLVSVMLANNETGVVQPVADICRKVRDAFGYDVFLHSDVAQAVGKVPVRVPELFVDAVTIVGHKFYGPRNGAVVFRSRRTVSMIPMLYGGGQEFGLRSGTENTPMIVGLGEAARLIDDIDTRFVSMHLIQEYFEQQLELRLKGAYVVNFKISARLPNTSSVAFIRFNPHACDLLEKCQTFTASTGAACHKSECSPTLLASGVSRKLASRTVRFSFGMATTRDEIDRAITELEAIVR